MTIATMRDPDVVAADWRDVAFATGPADRDRAEAGVAAAYAAAGLDAPERYVWMASPPRGAVAAAVLARRGDAGACVVDRLRTRPWEEARAAAYADLGPERWPQIWARTGGLLWNRVHDLAERLRRAIGDLAAEDHERPTTREEENVAAMLRRAALDAVLGQHEAPWLALFDCLGLLEGPLAGVAEVARSAGWWWPYERLVILTERPGELHRDEQGRLHSGDGPALAYPDGFALHAWRGTPMPSGFVASLTGLTADRITAESNAELRRVMLEVFGYERYLAETGAHPVHRDDTGVLWRIDLPGDEPVLLVEVVNATPEPDGTHRTYFLRVPPNTRTAREGVAWTFGVNPADYHPEKQT
ncbi:MAG TPA: hypothetical protein VIL71_08170 [Spirillospora sp.]